MTYDSFIQSKVRRAEVAGFDPPIPICEKAFDWQKVLIEWAVKRGRAALFEECGLGKTLQELEWARQVVAHTGGKVLILCPLGVVEQTVEEGRKLPPDNYEVLVRMARTKRVSTSWIVRDAVDKYLAADAPLLKLVQTAQNS